MQTGPDDNRAKMRHKPLAVADDLLIEHRGVMVPVGFADIGYSVVL